MTDTPGSLGLPGRITGYDIAGRTMRNLIKPWGDPAASGKEAAEGPTAEAKRA